MTQPIYPGLLRVVSKRLMSLSLVRGLRAVRSFKLFTSGSAGLVVSGFVVPQLAGWAVEQVGDTVALRRQKLSKAEYRSRSAQHAAGAVGGISGACAGAAFGSFLVPGFGAVIGAVAGSYAVGTKARQLVVGQRDLSDEAAELAKLGDDSDET